MRSSQFLAFLALFGLSALFSVPAHAAFLKDKEMCVGVIASVDGYANIREQPTTASRIRGTLNKGTDVNVYAVLKRNGQYWYRVNEGYIRANQIRRECGKSDGRPDFPYP